MADISSILSALGSAFGGGQNNDTNPNGTVPNISDPLARAGYWNWRNKQQTTAIDQQRANQEGSVYARAAAATMLERVHDFVTQNRFTLQVTGQLPMFQQLADGWAQTAADGDVRHVTGLPHFQEMMDQAALASKRFEGMTPAQRTQMWGSDVETQYEKDHPNANMGIPPPDSGATAEQVRQHRLDSGLGATPEEVQYHAAHPYQAPVTPPPSFSSQSLWQTPDAYGGAPEPSTTSRLYQLPNFGVDMGSTNTTQPYRPVTSPGIDPNTGSPFGAGQLGPAVVDQMSAALGQVSPNGLPGRATGGAVVAGQPYVVGEGGPETLLSDLAPPINYAAMPPQQVPPSIGSSSAPTASLSIPGFNPAGADATAPPPPPRAPAAGTFNIPYNPAMLAPRPDAPGSADTTLGNKIPPYLPIPSNPVEAASPGFANFSTQIYKQGLGLLSAFQNITPKQAQALAAQMVNNIYSDPAVLAAQADLSNTINPRFASTPDDTATAQKSYMDALKGATDKATQILNAEMAPITEPNKVNQQKLDDLKGLGGMVFGSEGVGGTVGKLMTAGLEPSKTSAGNIESYSKLITAENDVNTQIETARHNASAEEQAQVEPLLKLIVGKQSQRQMSADSWRAAYRQSISESAGVSTVPGGPGGSESGAFAFGLSAGMMNRQGTSEGGDQYHLVPIMALLQLAAHGNRYAQAIAPGILDSYNSAYETGRDAKDENGKPAPINQTDAPGFDRQTTFGLSEAIKSPAQRAADRSKLAQTGDKSQLQSFDDGVRRGMSVLNSSQGMSTAINSAAPATTGVGAGGR